jgi:hypothetical protein
MHTQVTAGDSRVETKKAACGTATFSRNSRELKPETDTLETSATRVNVNILLAARTRVGDLQRLARGRLNDLEFDWRKWADFVSNELMAAAQGDHVDRQVETHAVGCHFDSTTVVKTRTRRISWPKPCAATILCYGRHRLFDRLEDAPPAIVTDVEAGAADALARGRRIRFTADDIARALGITAAEKIAARAWQVGAVDVTAEEWGKIIRERRAEQKRKSRRQQGATPREDCVAALARAAGVKPDTMRARLRRAQVKAEKTGEKAVAFSGPPNKKKIGEATKTRQRSATAASRRTCNKSPSQLRHTPGRPKDGSAGEGVGRDVKKPISADAGKIPFEREKSWRPSPVASPTLSAVATIDHGLASTSLAEACP